MITYQSLRTNSEKIMDKANQLSLSNVRIVIPTNSPFPSMFLVSDNGSAPLHERINEFTAELVQMFSDSGITVVLDTALDNARNSKNTDDGFKNNCNTVLTQSIAVESIGDHYQDFFEHQHH